ncbi:unnamed protein product [Lupinus luteus]|uniref:PGG domain-containing protein n=1 Tax=Lupinus luteus TaxID=3873 RepID=A0AAV1WN53_LUPLU
MEGRNWSWNRQLTRYQNYLSEWMEQMRGSLMLVATVIAIVSFQIAINPPGSVWQSDTDIQQGCALNTTCRAVFNNLIQIVNKVVLLKKIVNDYQ